MYGTGPQCGVMRKFEKFAKRYASFLPVYCKRWGGGGREKRDSTEISEERKSARVRERRKRERKSIEYCSCTRARASE